MELIEQFATSADATHEATQVSEDYIRACGVLDRELHAMGPSPSMQELNRLKEEELDPLLLAAAGEPETPELRERLTRAWSDFEARMEDSGLYDRIRAEQADRFLQSLKQVDELRATLALALGLPSGNEPCFSRAFRRALFFSPSALRRNPDSDFWRAGDCVRILARFVEENREERAFMLCDAVHRELAEESGVCEFVHRYYLAIDDYCRDRLDAGRKVGKQWREGDGESSTREEEKSLERLRLANSRQLVASRVFCSSLEGWLRESGRDDLAILWTAYAQNALAPATCAALWGESRLDAWIDASLDNGSLPEEVALSIRQQKSLFVREQAELKVRAFEIAFRLARDHMIVNSGEVEASQLREQLLRLSDRRVANHETFLTKVAALLMPERRAAFESAVDSARRSKKEVFKIRVH